MNTVPDFKALALATLESEVKGKCEEISLESFTLELPQSSLSYLLNILKL